MPHVRESILDGIATALEGIASAPAVTRASAFPQLLPSINVVSTNDQLVPTNVNAIDHELEVSLVCAVASADGELDTAIAALEVEIWSALDGLESGIGGLVDLHWLQTGEPEIRDDDGDGLGSAAVAVITYRALYRHATDDPAAPA